MKWTKITDTPPQTGDVVIVGWKDENQEIVHPDQIYHSGAVRHENDEGDLIWYDATTMEPIAPDAEEQPTHYRPWPTVIDE